MNSSLTLQDRLYRYLDRHALRLLQASLGVVFLWFGALKLFPGVSPAEALACRTLETITFHTIPGDLCVRLLACWEVAIGLGLLTNRFLRTTLLLLALQMLGTFLPLVLFPETAFSRAPFVPTMEGQYIIKNLVLISAAIAVGGGLARRSRGVAGEAVEIQ